MIEKNLDKAIKRMENGESISAILSDSPERHRSDIASYLNIIQSSRAFPRKAVPLPAKRRLYLGIPATHASRLSEILGTFRIFGFAFTAAFLIVIGGLYTAYSALSSRPGDTLFSLRKVIEQEQLKLARTPDSKAELQINIADSRLADAQKALDQNSNTQIKEQVATELNTQTQSALNNIKDIAATPSISKNPQILTKVENLAASSNQLIAKVDPGAAQQAQQQSDQTITDIKKIISAANEQSNTDLSNPKEVTTKGTVTAINKTQITVDKNIFVINSGTAILGSDSQSPELSMIGIDDTVSVSAVLQGQTNLAKSITIISKAKAKPASDASKETPKAKPTPPADPNVSNSSVIANPKDTFSGFIPESPSGQ